MPTPIDELIFSDDEHDKGGGTNDIEDNVLGDTLNEEHPKEVELEESLPESRRAPSVLDVETEGETHSSYEENTDDENDGFVCFPPGLLVQAPEPRSLQIVQEVCSASQSKEPPINCVVVATGPANKLSKLI